MHRYQQKRAFLVQRDYLHYSDVTLHLALSEWSCLIKYYDICICLSITFALSCSISCLISAIIKRRKSKDPAGPFSPGRPCSPGGPLGPAEPGEPVGPTGPLLHLQNFFFRPFPPVM